MFLGISTSGRSVSVAVETGGGIKSTVFSRKDKPACEVLIQKADTLLKRHSLSINKISCIGVDAGPGSFTGIRTGIATANSLGLALNIPVFACSSLDMIALQYSIDNPGFNKNLCIALNAGRGQVYTASYAENLRKINKDHIETMEEFRSGLNGVCLAVSGFEREEFNLAEYYPDAASCIRLIKTKARTGKPCFAVPNYVRLPDAEINLKKGKNE